MELWMVFLIIAVLAITVETFIPAMFCINFAFAAIITAIISVFWGNPAHLIILFVILSFLSIVFIKPLLIKFFVKENKVDFEGQYQDKIVKCIENITSTSGAVTIYDERWEARLTQGVCEEIPAGCDVKIVGNDSTVLYVEKV